MDKKKIAIIGSGMSGLTAAAYMARAGHEVVVYEQFSEPGGVTRTLHKDGFSWDLGPLLLDGFGKGDSGTRILSEIGINDVFSTPPSDRGIVFPDFSLWKPDIYTGDLWRRDFLINEFPAEAAGIRRYYRFYRRMCRIMKINRRSNVGRKAGSSIARVLLLLNYLSVKKYESWSADRLMKYFFNSPGLRAVFTGILADLMVKPDEFPALGVPFFNIESAFDARGLDADNSSDCGTIYRYISNGCETLVSAVIESIRSAGGRIRTSAPVSRVEVESGRVAGVVVNGVSEKADIVIYTGGTQELLSDLLGPDCLTADYREIIRDQVHMESVFMVHLGVNYTPKQKSALCYYYGTYEIGKAVDEIRNGKYHEGRSGFLVYVPSMHSPGMAPENCHAVTVYTVAPNFLQDGEWEDRQEALADRLVAEAEKFVPGLKEGTITREIVSPADFRTMVYQKHHSFGGIAPVRGRSNPSYKTPVENLWLIGSQSESGGGVAGVMKGAQTAAVKILESLENSI